MDRWVGFSGVEKNLCGSGEGRKRGVRRGVALVEKRNVVGVLCVLRIVTLTC